MAETVTAVPVRVNGVDTISVGGSKSFVTVTACETEVVDGGGLAVVPEDFDVACADTVCSPLVVVLVFQLEAQGLLAHEIRTVPSIVMVMRVEPLPFLTFAVTVTVPVAGDGTESVSFWPGGADGLSAAAGGAREASNATAIASATSDRLTIIAFSLTIIAFSPTLPSSRGRQRSPAKTQ